MSELKAFELKVGKNLETESPLVVGVDNKWNSRIMSGDEVYLKSEADAVIAEKDKVIAYLKDIDSKNRSAYYKDLAMMAKDVEHNKYKRCLAMAWWCSAELGMLISTWESKIKHYKRWQQRWLELAEKFMEAK